MSRLVRSIGGWLSTLRPHYAPLALLAVATIIGQAATLIQRPLAWFTYDTPSYLYTAQQITGSVSGLVDPTRTPGYPTFLALILALVFHGSVPFSDLMTCRDAGQLGVCVTDLQYIVYAQVAVAIITLVEVYTLVFRLSHRRATSCIVSVLLALNLYLGSWERLVMTEFLSYWSLVTVVLIFERFVRRPTILLGVMFGIASFVSFMRRSFNIYV